MSTASSEFAALQTIIRALEPLDVETRARIVASAVTFLQVPGMTAAQQTTSQEVAADLAPPVARSAGYPPFSSGGDMSPKEFLFEKQPRSDVERIAVLAFYLTHFRETAHFKTLDLSKLNTEAAQPKFANTANSASNAVKQGYLVPSNKGMRQLSAVGERFVAALPDRDAARATMAGAKPRRKIKKSTTPSSTSAN